MDHIHYWRKMGDAMTNFLRGMKAISEFMQLSIPSARRVLVQKNLFRKENGNVILLKSDYEKTLQIKNHKRGK